MGLSSRCERSLVNNGSKFVADNFMPESYAYIMHKNTHSIPVHARSICWLGVGPTLSAARGRAITSCEQKTRGPTPLAICSLLPIIETSTLHALRVSHKTVSISYLQKLSLNNRPLSQNPNKASRRPSIAIIMSSMWLTDTQSTCDYRRYALHYFLARRWRLQDDISEP